MTDIYRRIDGLIEAGLKEENKSHKSFASLHEAYGVMREEYQGALQQLNACELILEDMYWNCVKNDDFEEAGKYANQILTIATRGVGQVAQLAAVAQKATGIQKLR